MAATGVNRPNENDPYKPNRYNREYYYKKWFSQPSWLRRSITYNPDTVLMVGLTVVTSVLMAAFSGFRYSHINEVCPFVGQYKVVRERHVIPRLKEKNMYN